MTSLNRDGALLTNATAVSWTAAFNVDVTGVDAGDLRWRDGGDRIDITGVTAIDAANYRVTVTTGAVRALQLNLVDDDSIANPTNGKLLGGNGISGAGDGSFPGQAYTVDKTVPLAQWTSAGTASFHQAMTITGTSGDAGGSGVATVVVKIVRVADGAVLAQGAATGTGAAGRPWDMEFSVHAFGNRRGDGDGGGYGWGRELTPGGGVGQSLTILKANPVISGVIWRTSCTGRRCR